MRGNNGALGDECVCAHNGAMSHHGAIEHHGAHANEAGVFHGAGVQGDTVPHGNVFAELAAQFIIHMQAAVVLHVAAFADFDGRDIAANGGVVPHVGIGVQGDAANEIGAGSNECRGMELRAVFAKGFDSHGVLGKKEITGKAPDLAGDDE